VDILLEGLIKAFNLLFPFDEEVYSITFLSIKLSLTATVISSILGIAAGLYLSFKDFWGKSFVISSINTGMAFPPVLVGLFVSILLWRNGILGSLGLLYTPFAIVIAQVIIATPLVTGISLAAFQNLSGKLPLQLMGLGASKYQLVFVLLKELKLPILAAVMAGFGSVISEVGASMMVGGNIKGYTRVLTTATVTETSKGNFDIAIALGVILLFVTFAINFILTKLQQSGKNE